MLRRIVALVLLATSLSGCSYGYEVLAIALNGGLAFVVSPKSDSHPSCVRSIGVMVADRRANSRVDYDTYWFESVAYNDACANRYPLTYGASLKGQHQQDGIVKAKALRREVVYDILTTTGTGGYGGGRFIIHANGHIENLG